MSAVIETDWVILGGGSAGMASVLALSGQLCPPASPHGGILILDQADQASGSSSHNPGRLHGGFHYPDPDTAFSLQDLLIHNLAAHGDRIIPHLALAGDDSLDTNWYAVLADDDQGPHSIFPTGQTVATFEALAQRWEDASARLPQLKALGDGPFAEWVLDADDWFAPRTERVARTLEPNLDVPSFLRALSEDALSPAGVDLITHDRVLSVTRLSGGGFELLSRHAGDLVTIRARRLNISAWEATEQLLQPLGYQFDTLNRIKREFRVRLGPSAEGHPSALTVYGPHAMIRNLHDGTGIVTAGHLSNVNTRRLPDTETTLRRLIRAAPDDRDSVSTEVLDHLRSYYPRLDITEITDVEYGVVKVFSTSGVIDLSDSRSDHHVRRADGWSGQLEPGLWVTWAMKLSSCLEAGEQFARSVASGAPPPGNVRRVTG